MATLTSNELDTIVTESETGSRAVSDKLKWLLQYAATALQVYAERRELSKLTDDQLQDIGISRSQASTETERSFFDLPNR